MIHKADELSEEYLCTQVEYEPELLEHLEKLRLSLVNDGKITKRMAEFMKGAEEHSSGNLCRLLGKAVKWDPRVAEIIDSFLGSHSKVSLKGHLALKNEFEIARSIDGYAGDELRTKLLKKLPNTFNDIIQNGNEAQMEQLIASAKFLQDIEARIVRCGPEFYFQENDKVGQALRVKYEAARGLLDHEEVGSWLQGKSKTFPFATSGALRPKNSSPSHRLSTFKPIIIYYSLKNLMDRSVYTFMDAMQPALLTNHRIKLVERIKAGHDEPPKGYTLDRGMLVLRDSPENLKRVLPKQHLALPEALAVSWGLEELPSSLVHQADYIEAQILGGVNLNEDVETIAVSEEIFTWLQQLVADDEFMAKNPTVSTVLEVLLSKGVLKPISLQNGNK